MLGNLHKGYDKIGVDWPSALGSGFNRWAQERMLCQTECRLWVPRDIDGNQVNSGCLAQGTASVATIHKNYQSCFPRSRMVGGNIKPVLVRNSRFWR